MATLSARLQAEIDRSNTATSATDTTVHNAITTLIAGYGQGGEDLTIGSTIVVTSEEGAVVTCTRGSKTYTGTVGSEGTVTFTVKSTGVWNITATIDTEEEAVTDTVEVLADNTTYTVSLSWRLPSIYQEVEYLKSTGSQYITTEWIPDLTKNLSIDGYAGFATSNRGMLISGFNFNSNLDIELFENACLRVYVNSDVINFGTGATIGTLYNFYIEYDSLTSVITATMNSKTGSGTYPSAGRIKNTNVAMIGTDYSNRYPYAIIGEITINNPELLYHFIPCYRKSDSVAGLWENVNKKFYTNSGTGVFIVGGDVA